MKFILSSNSPRRRQLLAGLDIDFEVKVLPGIDESYPDNLSPEEVPQFIAVEKAVPYLPSLAEDEILITADTVVVLGNEILGKPADADEACRCLSTLTQQRKFAVTSHVSFKELTDKEIQYYVDHYKPFDKAGAYGIQEWIGYIGVTTLSGSYFNVMGLPVQRIYQELTSMLGPDALLHP